MVIFEIPEGIVTILLPVRWIVVHKSELVTVQVLTPAALALNWRKTPDPVIPDIAWLSKSGELINLALLKGTFPDMVS
jgi:hypothetical protein